MPENLTSLLAELVDENSGRARPLPVESVGARGRIRRRRQRFTAAASTAVACAVATGVGIGFSGAEGGLSPAGAATPSPQVTRTASPTQFSTNMFLAGTELPDASAFQWEVASLPGATDAALPFPVCGTGSASGPVTSLHAAKARTYQYTSPNTSADGTETIYQYGSADAARSDYASLVPDQALCAKHPLPGAGPAADTGHKTASITDGYAWVQTGSIPGGPAVGQTQGQTQHVMVVLSGTTVAFFGYTEPKAVAVKYDTAGDAKALQNMATRLQAPDSIPGPAVAPAPNSAFLATSEVPFATANATAHGWTLLPLVPATQGKAALTALCGSSIVDVVGGANSTEAVHSYQGTPTGPQLEDTSQAAEYIHSYPDAASAAQAFARAKQLSAPQVCDKTIDGTTYNYTVTAGASNTYGFSFQIGDGSPKGSGLNSIFYRDYVVVRGTNVAQLTVTFINKDTTTAVAADSILAAMAAKLP